MRDGHGGIKDVKTGFRQIVHERRELLTDLLDVLLHHADPRGTVIHHGLALAGADIGETADGPIAVRANAGDAVLVITKDPLVLDLAEAAVGLEFGDALVLGPL